jgi:RNA polymerase sigma-70 factor, ECF subfamily
MAQTVPMEHGTVPAGRTPAGTDFAQRADPFRRELLAHCYRMLGSVHDAEDLVQETMLRAWRSYPDFDEERASLRTWLHRIATNACLNALDSRARRPLPSDLSDPSALAEAPRHPVGRQPEIPWLQPFPDALLGDGPAAAGAAAATAADPAAVVAGRDTIRLAFVAALQHLPARQRAVLILRDVLAWRAAEVAALLGITPTAVNSALQRARAQLERAAPAPEKAGTAPSARQRELADRYVAAFVHADVDTLTRLLADDVVLEMPPFPQWFRGRPSVSEFLAARALASAGRWRAIPVGANGQPAMGAYRVDDDGRHHAHSIQVLQASTAGITWIAAFQSPELFPAFGLPPVYPGEA